MNKEYFKILSIDGGGIRGIFPAMFLANLETKLKADGKENWQIYQNFDLITGTSTGGILAIALALGIPAQELYELYLNKAKNIFGNKKWFLFGQLRYAAHERDVLEKLIREKLKEAHIDGEDPILRDCKTNICIPVYDLLNGTPSVYKNDYHPKFTRDFHIPAYQVAMGSSAAPTYFAPYNAKYRDLNGLDKTFNNKIDGGVFSNNPALIGIIEAQEAFGQKLSNLKVLSLGTGYQKFSDAQSRKKWGVWYWMVKKKRGKIIDLFMQGQSQTVENLISLMQVGIDKERKDNPSFVYHRITTEMDSSNDVAMDETDINKLKALAEKAHYEFNNHSNEIIETYCN